MAQKDEPKTEAEQRQALQQELEERRRELEEKGRELQALNQRKARELANLLRQMERGMPLGADEFGADEYPADGYQASDLKPERDLLERVQTQVELGEQKYQILLEQFQDKAPQDQIIRSIEFAPEYRQVGLGILNYFSEILQQRYPDIPVMVRIEQEGQQVRMIVETDKGHLETVERTLEQYGLVVAGQMPPAELLPNEFDVLALQQKLDIAKMELQSMQRHLQLAERYNDQQKEQITQQNQRLTKLEDAHLTLLNQVGSALHKSLDITSDIAHSTTQHTHDITAMFQTLLIQVAGQQHTAVRHALENLQTVMERGVTEADTEAVATALATVKQHRPTLYNATEEVLFTLMGGLSSNILTKILESTGLLVP